MTIKNLDPALPVFDVRVVVAVPGSTSADMRFFEATLRRLAPGGERQVHANREVLRPENGLFAALSDDLHPGGAVSKPSIVLRLHRDTSERTFTTARRGSGMPAHTKVESAGRPRLFGGDVGLG